MMDAKQAFGVLVRTLGLLGMLYGAVGIVDTLVIASTSGLTGDMLRSALAISLVYMTVGFLLLIKPDWFVNFAYRSDKTE